MSSSSEKRRKLGNEFYVQASNADTPRSIRISRYLSAIREYNEAKSLSQNFNDTLSCQKNLAMSSMKLVELYSLNEEVLKVELESLVYHFKEAMVALYNALERDRVATIKCKGEEWVSKLLEEGISFVSDLSLSISVLPFTPRIRLFHRLNSLTCVPFQHILFFEIGEANFKQGVVEMDKARNYQGSLNAMAEATIAFKFCMQLKQENAHLASVYLEDICLQENVARSSQAFYAGDDILEAATLEDDALNLDGVFTALDKYREAIILARECYVLGEAMGLCGVARIYRQVLKMPALAKENYSRANQLILSLEFRVHYHGEDWYDECLEALKQFQEEAVSRDQAEKEKARQVFLDALSEELKALTASLTAAKTKVSAKGTTALSEFLKFVYLTHPPRDATHKHDPNESIKKQLLKAAGHYHPDKNSRYSDPKWLTLCEEITKMINGVYNQNIKQMGSD